VAVPGQRTGERKAGPDLNVNLYFVDWFYRVDPINRMIIPLGLSYLVFTVISYLVEIKRKNIEAERHFGYFSLYLLFFPRIAQGPIERPQKLLPQLREVHSFDYDLVTSGLKLMLWGYFKKQFFSKRRND
jgi:D-alanyl-lipoteichoic acid acyltransferase DltB (MBOAT superfamily)